MKVAAVIAEYNPFHNGHLYHIASARSLSGADYIIVLMSGNYTQRGVPAIMDKYTRTQMALLNGADLVLELPLPYAAGSAEYFAAGSIALLERLGIVDFLCFGSECGDIYSMKKLAAILNEEPVSFIAQLKACLKKGISFPAARNQALLHVCQEMGIDEAILSSPNNILGIEYIRALLREHSSIMPLTIKRKGSGYHESALTDTFSSATAIRQSWAEQDTLNHAAQTQIPDSAFALIAKQWGHCMPIYPNDFSLLLQYTLLQKAPSSLHSYCDVTPELSNRIYHHLPSYASFDGFCSILKSKDMTYTRISRSLLHIMLDITDNCMEQYAAIQHAPYARILGFRSAAGALLQSLKQNTSVPCITKLANASSYLNEESFFLLQKEITAAHIYEAVISQKFHSPMKNEYTRQIIIL